MGRHHHHLSLLSLLLVPATTLAQIGHNPVTVTGIVLTEGDNRRIEHAVVRLCDAGGNLIEETATPENGEFNFRGIQRGRYILTFEANGLQKTEVHLDLSYASDRGMTVYMKPAATNATVSAGGSISAHELSLPETARNLANSGKRKLHADRNAQGALADLNRAVQIAPGYYEAYCEMALAYLTLGRAAEAEKSFGKAIELSHDTYGDAEIGLGTMLVEKGEASKGEKSIQRGVELNPNSWMGFYELGKLDLSRNELNLAQKSAERAKLLAPNTPIVYRLLAKIHMQQKNYSAVLEDIDAYLKLDPDSPAGVRAKEMRQEVEQEVAKHAGRSGKVEP